MLALQQVKDVARRSAGAVLDDGSPAPALPGNRPGKLVTHLKVETAHQQRGLLPRDQHGPLGGA